MGCSLYQASLSLGCRYTFLPPECGSKLWTGCAQRYEAFEAMFAPYVVGANNKTRERKPGYPAFLPTNEQAEVLIPNRIAREDLFGIYVLNEAQAKRETASLKKWNVQFPRILIAPYLFVNRGG